MLKTTGKPIKWIICFSPVLSKVFLQKSFTKNHKNCRKLKKSVLGPVVHKPPQGYNLKDKELGLDKNFSTTEIKDKIKNQACG